MAFSEIPEVKSADAMIDSAFSRAKKANVQKKADPLKRKKLLVAAQIDCIRDSLKSQLDGIIKRFPSIDSATEFYGKLIKATVDYAELKKSLGAVAWASKKVNELSRKYLALVAKAGSEDAVLEYKKQYYGRISSVPKQIKDNLKFLDQCRRKFRDFPSIKSGLFTVCISGFPNVGKSTLLSKITEARPEIKSYAFTTKKLNLGYFTSSHEKVQVIDTPGTLNRFSVMNSIEKQAHLALKYLANMIIYVFDPTEEYEMDLQYRLFENTLDLGKSIVVYYSKTDIVDKDIADGFIAEFSKKFRKHRITVFKDAESVQEEIVKVFSLWKKDEVV